MKSLPNQKETLVGSTSALMGCIIWGLAPIYFKAVSYIPTMEVLSHRIVWSVFLLGFLVLLKSRGNNIFLETIRAPRTYLYCMISAALMATNWLVYVWAIQHGRLLEASMGYFINPLLYVCWGVIFFDERLRKIQTIAIGIAFIGILYLMVATQRVPWVAFTLAGAFSFYGVFRKKSGIDSFTGMFIEILFLAPIFLSYLIYLDSTDRMIFGEVNTVTDILLLFGAVITVAPLALFLEGVKRLRFSTAGIMHYLSPTLQFALAVLAYHETFDPALLVTFACIWGGLAIYSYDSLRGRAAQTG
ncbi:MAG: EamA family transporter RarD [Chlamydiota bacterium]